MDESRAPDDTPTWEQSKENVLPLKSGRKLNELSAALSGGGSAECKLREQQEAFELELRMYAGDDPLEPWCRYVSWVEQNYPRGGREANLKSLLEKCVSTFLSDARYTNEKRFVDLCIKLANIFPEPNDVFAYLHSHSVGCELAGFFIAWSWVLENSGHLKMADAVLQEGLGRGAQPVDKLRKCIHEFQARVVLSIANSADDGVATALDGADLGLSAGVASIAGSQQQPQRSTLAELRVNRQGKVGHDRVSGALSAGPLTLGSTGMLSAPARQQLGGKPWKMFTDGDASSGATLPPQNKEWVTMPEAAPKENTFNPVTWTKAKVPQKLPSSATVRGHASGGSSSSSGVCGSTAATDSAQFTVHCDQEEPVATAPRSGSIKTTTGSSIEGAAVIGYRPVLSSRKVEAPSNAADRLNSLRDAAGTGSASETTEVVMYDRNKLYMGVTELSFEELRAGVWLKHYRMKMELKKEVEEQSRALAARLQAEQEAQLERLRLAQAELEMKQRELEAREQELERRQRGLAAVTELPRQRGLAAVTELPRQRGLAAVTELPKQWPQQPDQQSEQQQQPKRPRLHADCAQPGLRLDQATTKSQPTSANALGRSTGENDPSVTAVSSQPAKVAAPLTYAASGHAIASVATKAADDEVGELLSTSVGQLNLADRPASSRAPLSVLAAVAAPVSPPVKHTAPTAVVASSPAEGETRHVLGWYCGSFNTSTARSAPPDQYNASTCSEQASVQPSPDHGPRFYVHLDESSVASGTCNPQPGDVHRKLLVYEDPVEPAAAPTGGSGCHRSASSSSSSVGPLVGLDVTGQDVTDRQSNNATKEARATLADQQWALQPAAGGRLQIFEDEPIVDHVFAGRQQQPRGTGPVAGGDDSRQCQPLEARVAATIPGPIALNTVRDACLREQSAPEKDCGTSSVSNRRPESVETRAGIASAITAFAATAGASIAVVPQQQHSAFRPFGGSHRMDQDGAAASIKGSTAAPWQLKSGDGFDKENRASCKGSEPKGTTASKSSLDEEAAARRVQPRFGAAEPPRAAPTGPRTGLRPTEEEPMDGVETTQNDLTEQLLGASAVAPFAARQASTPCSYRSSAADGLLAACCPEDLTTIHPVLLGSAALRLPAFDEDCGLEERHAFDAAGAPSRAGSASGETRGHWQPESAAEPSRPGLRPQAPLSLTSASALPPSDSATTNAPIAAATGAGRAALSTSGQAAQTANDTAPSTFVRRATLRLSPIAERSDSSKASSSTASSAQSSGSSGGHHSTTVGSSMSSQALSRLASMSSAATTPHHAVTRDASSLQTSASSSSLQQSQQSLAQRLQGQLQQQQQTVEPAKPAERVQLQSQRTMCVTLQANGSGRDVASATPIADSRNSGPVRADECDPASSPFEEASTLAAGRRQDAAPGSYTADDDDELVLPPPPADIDNSDDLLLFERHRGCGGMNATSHEIDTTHYSPAAFLDTTQSEKPLNASIAAVKNPFDSKSLSKLLDRLRPPLSTYAGYCKLLAALPATIKVNQKLNLGDCSYTIVRKVGEGGFASVYVASCNVDQSNDLDVFTFKQASVTGSVENLCLKVQQSACGGQWEFYMCREVNRRLSRNLALGSFMTDVRSSIMDVPRGYFLANGSVLVNEYVPAGSLLNLVNEQLASKCRLPEAVVMYLAIELLSIVEQLHACGIIHGDIKPDNLLLRGLFPLTPNSEMLCSKTRSLLLIDFGRSIDMTKFPEGTTFSVSNETSGFQCIEMKTDRPWTYQTDLFGLVGTIHVLLFGEYMKVYCAGKQWKINSKYQRFWQVDLWRNMFETLLNVPDCDSIPPLAPFRRDLEQRLRSSKLSKEYQDFVDRYNSAPSRRS